MFSLAIWKTCSPRTFATFFSSGTEFKSASTPTVAAVYPTVVVLVAPLPAIVPPVARIMTLPSVFGARASAAADSATANTPSPDTRSNLRLPRETAVRGEAVCGELEFTMIVGMIGPLFDRPRAANDPGPPVGRPLHPNRTTVEPVKRRAPSGRPMPLLADDYASFDANTTLAMP